MQLEGRGTMTVTTPAGHTMVVDDATYKVLIRRPAVSVGHALAVAALNGVLDAPPPPTGGLAKLGPMGKSPFVGEFSRRVHRVERARRRGNKYGGPNPCQRDVPLTAGRRATVAGTERRG